MRRAAGGEAAHAAIWCEPEGPGDYDVIEALWLPSQERGASSLRSLNRSLRGGTTALPSGKVDRERAEDSLGRIGEDRSRALEGRGPPVVAGDSFQGLSC